MRDYRARHGHGLVLRGETVATPQPKPRDLARAIFYAHRNPLKTTPPLVTTEVHFLWSSARAYAGLSCARYPNVARAVALMGDQALYARPPAPPLEELDVVAVARVSPARLLVAAAHAFGLMPEELRLKGRGLTTEAKRVFVALGRLEGWRDRQLRSELGVTRGRITQLAIEAADPHAVRVARTILRLEEAAEARVASVASVSA